MSRPARDKIEKLLVNAGYRRSDGPLKVSGADFEFDVFFEGPSNSDSLIIVVEVKADRAPLLMRRIRSLRRSMLRSGSSRSLTLLTIGHELKGRSMREMERYCRVISVLATESVRDALLELLPIKIPPPPSRLDAPEEMLMQTLNTEEARFYASFRSQADDGTLSSEDAALRAFEDVIRSDLTENTDDDRPT